MINIAICDDNKSILNYIKNEICRIMDASDIAYDVKLYEDPKQLICNADNIALCFLDIEMPEISGFELAKKLMEQSDKPYIIFVSNHESKVFQSYEYEPLWFIPKNRLEEALPRALNKFIDKFLEEKDFYQFTSGAYHKTVRIKDVIYLECIMHTITVYTTSGVFEIYGSLKKIEMDLGKYRFIRIHKNYLVNKRYIFSVDAKTVTLADNCVLPLSKARKKQVKERLFEQ